uniref:Uncharacterized protein n=1 Tax=Arundo donax TaxID=35708 RepID=A0A0A9HCS8_ARUDO
MLCLVLECTLVNNFTFLSSESLKGIKKPPRCYDEHEYAVVLILLFI